jgi:carboxyl-terminal processing protease
MLSAWHPHGIMRFQACVCSVPPPIAMPRAETSSPRRPPVKTLTVLAILTAGIAAVVVGAQSQLDAARLFHAVLRTVQLDGADSLSEDALYEKAARGLVRELNDPYAELYSPTELANAERNQLSDRYGGLGMTIENQLGAITIVGVFPGSPAAGAHIAAGDRIVSIEGQSIAGWTSDQVTDRLTGPAGSSIAIAVSRAGVSDPIRHRMTRAIVQSASVPYTLLYGSDVGYIPIKRFNSVATQEVRSAVLQLRREGATSFVLDLRQNGGGQLNEALGISNLFLDSGATLVSIHYRGQPTETIVAEQPPVASHDPLVVLVDRNTASASEIVAGALQDHDRAAIVGVPTYGKGLVQTMFPLDGGWAVKMTTGRWVTPRGRSIHRARPYADGHVLSQDSEPHAMTAALAHAGRPTVTSDAGRTLYGGGGIVPDVVVAADTLTSDQQRLIAAVAPRYQLMRVAIYDFARDLNGHVKPSFTVPTVWRDSLYDRFVKRGLTIDRHVFDDGATLMDRLAEEQVAEIAFGDSSAFRRRSTHDAPLQRALELLHHASSMPALLTIARDDSAGSSTPNPLPASTASPS